jgi:FixJ family two-component response regulator
MVPPRFLVRRKQPSNPRVLALIREGPNLLALRSIFQEAGLALTFWERRLPNRVEIAPIVIFDRELSPVHWPDQVRDLANKSPRPYIILLSSSIDTNLWDELQRVGGSDILRTPLDRESLLAAIRRAWQLWRSLRALRDDPLANGIED